MMYARWHYSRAGALGSAVFALAACSSPDAPTPVPWHQLEAPGPSPRWAHAAVFDPKRRDVVLFGGFGAGNEIWLFSFKSRTWIRVDAPNGPTPRASPNAVADPTRDRIVVFGGVAAAGVTNEMWAFDLATHAWSTLPTGPAPRWDAGIATDGARAWIYGGFAPGLVGLDDLWEFDLASNRWTELPEPSPKPIARTNMGLAEWNGSLYMTGGHDARGDTPGTWRYDLTQHAWQQLSPSDTPRAGAHSATDVDRRCGDLILAGGDHDDGVGVATTDYLLLTSTPRFVYAAGSGPFAPRRHATLVMDQATRELLLFGGIEGSATVYGDTWLSRLGNCP
jgi:hypothetical protein